MFFVRSRSTRDRLTATYVAISLVLLALGALVGDAIWTARQSDFDRASVEAENMATSLSQEIGRTLELYDLSIQGALDDIAKPEVMRAPKFLRQLILFDRAATASFLGHILVLDETGAVVANSDEVDLSKVNFADRAYFHLQAERPDLGLYVSEPLISRAGGYKMIALSRRYNKPDGSFGGVVVGTIKIDYFHSLFSQLKMRSDASITLFRSDGTLLMREPYNPSLIGSTFKPAHLLELAHLNRQGQYQARSAVDGVERLFRFKRIGTSPLIQSVGMSLDEVYAQWRRRTTMFIIVFFLSAATIICLMLFLGRELKRRAEAEIALQKLSDCDALTGLANRRQFDRVLSIEWSRAARERQPLSLLMIDADQFKLFNDTFGHPAGDQALVQIAACLAAGARRPSDLVARYGGEEFAILLPCTDAAGAKTVAEAVRTAVLARAIDHPQATKGICTISVGVVAKVPGSSEPAERLVIAADEALYVSKEAGRNRTTCFDMQAAPIAA